jgi:ornithine cyclodeaminase
LREGFEVDAIPFLPAGELHAALSWRDAVDALEEAFRSATAEEQPRRTHLSVSSGELLLMPAQAAPGVGVKVVTLNPANRERGLPFIHGLFLSFDPYTLAPEALLDGAALTAIRTAAVSALATRHLARADARRLVVFGAGAQGFAHVDAMRAVRPIETVGVVATRSDRAESLVRRLVDQEIDARVVGPDAVAQADIVCTCTPSDHPLFPSASLPDGAHVNAIGSYRPDLRELDGPLLRRARLVVETRAAALAEAGDIIQAIQDGEIEASHIAGDLHQVVTNDARRTSGHDLTVFKSVGLAFEDVVIARALLRVARPPNSGR